MKIHHKILFSMLFIPFVVSCIPNRGASITSDMPNDSSINPDDPVVDDDIFDKGYTNIPIDGEVYYLVTPGLYVNKEPGLYKKDFDLKFAYNKKKAKLYYNYSGEKPILNKIYSLDPFKAIEIYENVPETNDEIPMSVAVDEKLRDYNNRCVSYNYINNIQDPGTYQYFHNACVVDISFIYNDIQTDMSLTYLVDSTKEYTLPMVFLSMPFRKWFGSPYYFYNNIYEEDVEQRVQLEFFDPVTKDYWQRNSKIKVGGGWSKGYPQRTLNLNFKKDEKGNKNERVNYDIFTNRKTCGDTTKPLTKHARFRLHNGGNCFEQWSGFNDAILQRAMFGTNVATTAYRPCLVYLNGEYWGLMSLREHYSDYYIQQNYGVSDDNVTMFEVKGGIIFDDGDEGGTTYLYELETLLKDSRFNSSNQATVEQAYQELTAKVDMDSLIDALLCEYYCCNWDYVGNYNNLKMWRVMETSDKKYEDGKWRFCLHDADFAFTEHTNFFDKNVDHSYNNWPLVKDCMKSKTFRTKMVQRAEELANNNLKANNLSDITTAMYNEVKDYKRDSGKRWGQPNNYYNDWINYKTYLLNYFQTRSSDFVSILKDTINNQYGGY